VSAQESNTAGSGGRHKIEVRDRVLGQKMAVAGARLIGDYGGYQLYDAPDSMTHFPADKAELRDDYNFIELNAGRLDTTQPAVQALRKTVGSFAGKRMHLVQFAGPVQTAWRQALLDAGVKIVSYIPHNTYLVYGDATSVAGVQALAAAPHVQWEGAYADEYKIHPAAKAGATKGDQFAIQLTADDAANAVTLQLIDRLKLAPLSHQRHVLDFVDVVARVAPADLPRIAARPDVISIQPYGKRRKVCERQDQIVAGNLSGDSPSGPGYLNWLESRKFTQEQFTASGFSVDMSDSGIDNGSTHPNHFGLYVLGETNQASRVIYNRLEGTPSPGSTIEGCDGHGNINAHIVGGYDNGSVFPFVDSEGYHYGLGVCPYVSLGSSVIFDPTNFTDPNYEDLMSQAYADGARVSNNSWGGEGEDGIYDLDTQEYDALVRDAQPEGSAYAAPGNQEMVIVFASGNDGPTNGSVEPPGTGKNIICVGAAESVQIFGGPDGGADIGLTTDSQADNANAIVSYSGLGPCKDGRKKPDLVAPGTHISGGAPQATDSGPTGSALLCFLDNTLYTIGVAGGPGDSFFFPTNGQEFYTASSGTSHSTPCVSGGCALLRQYFINQNWTPPSPATTKAWLMNSARYLTGPGADDTLWSHSQGMGEMDLGTAFDGTPRILRDEAPGDMFTASGQTRVFTGVIQDASQPFRVTAAWTDAPGSTTGAAYNNDLDLTVTAGGKTYKGNVFSGSNSVAGGTADLVNNVESVFLPAGVSGPFKVTLTAANINSAGVPNAGNEINQDFALVVYNAGPAPTLAAVSAVLVAETCAPTNGVIDPGESVTVEFTIENAGSGSTTNLVATLLASDGVVFPTGPQTYGVLAANSSGTAAYSFEAGGACGGIITASLQLQDGTANMGTVSYNLQLGKLVTTTNFAENFDEVTPPNLPAGWTTSNTTGQTNWITESGVSDSAPNAVYCQDSDTNGEVFLVSPPITLPDGPSQLSFRQSFNLEDEYDGGVLQIKIGSGGFEDIVTAGGRFFTGGYVEQLSEPGDGSCKGPLFDQNAWSGASDGFMTTTVNLPSSAEGKAIQLRWICGTDCTNEFLVGIGGWWIDSITITQTNWSCCSPVPVILAPIPGLSTNNGSLTVTGTGVAGAKVSVDDGANVLGTATVSSSGKFSVAVKLPNGVQELTATQTLDGVSSAPSAAISVTMNLKPTITSQPQSQLAGFVGETVKFSSAAYGAAPLSYTWEKNGVKIAGATTTNLTLAALVSNSASSYKMIASNSYGSVTSAPGKLTVAANPFTYLTGSYYGLFTELPAQFPSSGYMTLTLGPLGTYTARILNAGGNYSFTGAFSITGQSQTAASRGTGVAPLIVNMNLDLTSNTEQILGTVSNAEWSAGLQADRATFSETSLCPNAGKYTLVLESGDGSLSPGGYSYLNASISDAGVVSFSGVMSDNTSVGLLTSGISKFGQWPLYVALYNELGSLSGWIDFTNGGSVLPGNASWFRIGPYGKLYPAGFTNYLTNAGSAFMPGTARVPVLSVTNFIVTLSGGGLGSNNLSNSATLRGTGAFVTNSTGIPKLMLSVSPGTGVISGSFMDPSTRLTTPIKGVVLQQQTNAAGFFEGTNATGKFVLTPE